MTCLIPIRKANEIVAYAIVDQQDFKRTNAHRWRFKAPARPGMEPNGVRTTITQPKRIDINMGRFIMKLETGDPRLVDHKNGDFLDNRRSNLRICDSSANMQNQKTIGKSGTSTYRGVTTNGSRYGKPWRATGVLNGRIINLGGFMTEIDAARVAQQFRFDHYPDSLREEVI